jgi:hypothetical protein
MSTSGYPESLQELRRWYGGGEVIIPSIKLGCGLLCVSGFFWFLFAASKAVSVRFRFFLILSTSPLGYSVADSYMGFHGTSISSLPLTTLWPINLSYSHTFSSRAWSSSEPGTVPSCETLIFCYFRGTESLRIFADIVFRVITAFVGTIAAAKATASCCHLVLRWHFDTVFREVAAGRKRSSSLDRWWALTVHGLINVFFVLVVTFVMTGFLGIK